MVGRTTPPGGHSAKNRPFVIPVFIPNKGCRHRCVFCNQSAVTGAARSIPGAAEIRHRVRRHLEFRGAYRTTTQIAFYGGNFLGLPAEVINTCLTEAERFVSDGLVDGIRFSTRPDTVSDASLDQIASFSVASIELGVQSMDDRVLRRVRREHTAADSRRAVIKLRERGYEIGCQIMVGLPADDDAGAMATGLGVASLAPDFVRIYPTVVLAGTELAEWYQASRFTPMPLEECVDLVKRLYLLFCEYGIRVVRMGLQATEELDGGKSVIAGPYHPAFGHMVHSKIFFDRAVSVVRELISARSLPIHRVLLRVCPGDEPRMHGLKGTNLAALRDTFPGLEIRIVADAALTPGTLAVSFLDSR